MINSVHETGTSIQQSLHWVSESEIIFLFMDNAGRHGTDEIKRSMLVFYGMNIKYK
jgi:hypothetical protein